MKKTTTLKTTKLHRTTRLRRISAACKIRTPAGADQASTVPCEPDPDIPEAEALEQARTMVVRATPKITEEIIKQAKLGSYLHARMLFDFAGLTAAQPPESASVSPVLELFLKQMETPPAKPELS